MLMSLCLSFSQHKGSPGEVLTWWCLFFSQLEGSSGGVCEAVQGQGQAVQKWGTRGFDSDSNTGGWIVYWGCHSLLGCSLWMQPQLAASSSGQDSTEQVRHKLYREHPQCIGHHRNSAMYQLVPVWSDSLKNEMHLTSQNDIIQGCKCFIHHSFHWNSEPLLVTKSIGVVCLATQQWCKHYLVSVYSLWGSCW